MIYTFRDPWFYEDPETKRTHLLFEANTPLSPADREAIPPDRRPFNGSVGVAVSDSGDPLEWELRSPLLTAPGVNQELERPHVVRQDGRYYLFVSSHMHTFAPGLAGFDAPQFGHLESELRPSSKAPTSDGAANWPPDHSSSTRSSARTRSTSSPLRSRISSRQKPRNIAVGARISATATVRRSASSTGIIR